MTKEETAYLDKVIEADLAATKKRIENYIYDSELSADERFMALKFHLLDKKRKEEYEEAQNKIMNGTYGTCSCCGKSIGLQRLMACPTAGKCMSCCCDEYMK